MDDEVKEKYIRAGKLAAQALEHGRKLIAVGVNVKEVLDSVEAFILENGGGIAFPAQISINETAAHFCPKEEDETLFAEGDIVKLDVGAHIDGWVGDNAVTVYLGDDEEKRLLVEASKAARDAAIAHVKAGVTPHELGVIIYEEITKRGFQPIRNLSGHGVAQYQIHTSPSIPNYPNNDGQQLKAGMVIAIEPFATTGKGYVIHSNENTLFSLNVIKPVRSPLAREALKKIKEYNGLPFTTRWLSKQLGVAKARFALQQLKQAGILNEYPPLVEEAKGLVSQSEHTLLIEEDGCKVLTKA